MTDKQIIYDVGANDGSDTDFYLSKGFSVVAIEADPKLAAQLETRFATQITDGRLTVLNIGVSDSAAQLDFFVNEKDDWSSFVAAGKATKTNSFETIQVETRPLAEVIKAHGVPYYLKMDIEGFEQKAISTLSSLPQQATYLSFEINAGLHPILTDLDRLGYDRFQMVRQGPKHLIQPPFPAKEGQYREIAFMGRHSGCFGLELPDVWLDRAGLDAALADLDATKASRAANGARDAFWHDIHARHATVR